MLFFRILSCGAFIKYLSFKSEWKDAHLWKFEVLLALNNDTLGGRGGGCQLKVSMIWKASNFKVTRVRWCLWCLVKY
jgi:hypothetical protein